MVRNMIDNHSGMHNRITHEILLRPFTLYETKAFFQAKAQIPIALTMDYLFG